MSTRHAHPIRRMWLGLSLALCTSCSSLPHAPAGDSIAHGKLIALADCSDCHVVARDQGFSPTVNVSAPSFLEIAARSSSSAHSLQRFIRKTHWDGQTIPITMPAPQLTREQTVAVADYILSLRTP